MSVEALTAVLHHSKARGTAKLVLLGIANHEGDGGAWPTVETLARYAGLVGSEASNARHVRKLLGELVALGELQRDVNAGGTADRDWWRRPNLYRVLVSCPPECDRTTRHRPVDNPPVTPGATAPPPVPQHPLPPVPQHRQTVPTTQPPVNQVPASTTDRARETPAAPPTEQLREVRAQLHAASATVHQREKGHRP